ncbi:hypothetical protein DMN91_002441 [Ooceraea biroi]|uniref:Uncharacterized protein n=1 Tax=Ooceraea biroi TaxID=2015173 RepID=A0A3L8DVU0_OOCBI|nr:hypothetical protein DMN91_002441 [Ooceraea biroi]
MIITFELRAWSGIRHLVRLRFSVLICATMTRQACDILSNRCISTSCYLYLIKIVSSSVKKSAEMTIARSLARNLLLLRGHFGQKESYGKCERILSAGSSLLTSARGERCAVLPGCSGSSSYAQSFIRSSAFRNPSRRETTRDRNSRNRTTASLTRSCVCGYTCTYTRCTHTISDHWKNYRCRYEWSRWRKRSRTIVPLAP